MKYYTGLDVSLKTTAICIMNDEGKIIREFMTETDPSIIVKAIMAVEVPIEKAALECCGISHWLVKELQKLNLPVICIDARKMAAAISINTNKTDKNDAREIANAVRTGYYKEIYQKPDLVVETQSLLTARRILINQRTATSNCIRGILKCLGHLQCGSSQNKLKFIENVKDIIKELSKDVQLSINALLNSYRAASVEIELIDKAIEEITEVDEDIQLLKTIPGVGVVTALTYKLEIDDPSRFKKSRTVGAYVGMTPRQYSSGESKKLGSISKTGSGELRKLLCDSAMCLMYNVKAWSKLKLFGLKIKKKHGHRKAIVALGRKLAVVMHRMMIDRKPFEHGSVEAKEIELLNKVSKRKTKNMAKQSKQNMEISLVA